MMGNVEDVPTFQNVGVVAPDDPSPQAQKLPCVRGGFAVRCRKGERYMKATGIVRRVEECVIIGQKSTKPA